ncbi:MAG: GAF domain-containing protein [Anaerolineae bacterium]|nr:GAF domain-containing protein [Anaerolineae bacterium]
MLSKFFRNLSLGVKLNVAIVLVFAILLAILSVIVTRGIDHLIAQMGQQRAAQEAAVIQSRFSETEQLLSTNAKLLVNTPGLIEALADEEITRFRTLLAAGAAPLEFDYLELVNTEGDYLIGGEHEGNPQEAELVALALLGIDAQGIIVQEMETGEQEFQMAVALPLRDVTSKILGVLIAGRVVDEKFLTEINFARIENVSLGLIYAGQIVTQDYSEVGTGELASLLEETSAAYEQALGGQIAVVDHLLFSPAGMPRALAYTPLIMGGEIRAVIGVVVQYRDLFVFQRQLLKNTAIAFLLTVVVVIGVIIWINWRSITVPLERFSAVARQMAEGDYSQRVEVTTGDEVGQLGRTFNDMVDRLQQTLTDIERRSRDLELRSAYLEASADVGREVALILDTEMLVEQVVDMIKERLDMYYVGLFLVDETGEWNVLRAGTGRAGRQMVARGHRLKAGEGMVGWSIANVEARIALDVGEDAVHFSNPDLPDTRSEAALPLRSRGRVLGALTVQSDREAAFDHDAVVVLQTMADHVAVALDNADLFARSQRALEAERRAYGEVSRDTWLRMAHLHPDLGYLCDIQGNVAPVTPEWRPEMVQVGTAGQIVHVDDCTMGVPLKIRDQVVGVVRLRKSEGDGEWRDQEVSLMEALIDQLGRALEGAQLYQDTQRRAVREQLAAHVTAQMRQSLDLETVLRTAASEMRQALGLEGVIVQLARPEEMSDDA